MLQCPECLSRATLRDYREEWQPHLGPTYCWTCWTQRGKKVAVVRVKPRPTKTAR